MVERFIIRGGTGAAAGAVLKKAQAELMNWHSSGMSVMEMSHRGSLFQEIHAGAKKAAEPAFGPELARDPVHAGRGDGPVFPRSR